MTFIPGTLTVPIYPGIINPDFSTCSYLLTKYTEEDSELVIIGHYRTKQAALAQMTKYVTLMFTMVTATEPPYDMIVTDKSADIRRGEKLLLVYRITELPDNQELNIETF